MLVLAGARTQVPPGPRWSPGTGTAQLVLGSAGQPWITQGCVAGFKGTVQQDFRLPVFFFIQTSLHGPLINGPKYFRFWLRFRRGIQTLVSKKLTRRGMIPRGD